MTVVTSAKELELAGEIDQRAILKMHAIAIPNKNNNGLICNKEKWHFNHLANEYC